MFTMPVALLSWPTRRSDFHGDSKGDIAIGTGRGNLKIPYLCVEEIRAALARRAEASA